MHYNKFEYIFAAVLAKYPRKKRIIKRCYQYINFLIYKRKETFWCKNSVYAIEIDNEETFFGYYDKSPLKESSKKVLLHSTSLSSKKVPDPEIPINICLYDFEKKDVIKKFTSNAYNWQQGSRCQWLNEKQFVFNDFDKIRMSFISKIVNATTGKIEKVINFPIYDTYNSYSLTLNFQRLMVHSPDYGYRNKPFEHLADDQDGVFYIDFEKNSAELLISLQKISELVNQESPYQYDFHEINHIMISPNGSSFIFLYRMYKNGIKKDRLIWSNIAGNKIKVLNQSEMVSHCYWINENTIVAYMRDYDLGDKYLVIDLIKGNFKLLGEGLLNNIGDGHPNVNGDLMLIDTYPNKARIKELFLYNIKKFNLTKLAHFLEPLSFNDEMRCDLHPRWSDKGSYIFFDSVHTGKRLLYYMKSGNE